MSNSISSQAPPPRGRRIAWIVTLVFAVLILIPSMLGFVMKFMELINLTQGETDGGFAITPVVNYLFASAGFFCLLLWAAVNGMFNDLEKPKFAMLENEEALDADEREGPKGSGGYSVWPTPPEPTDPGESARWGKTESA